MSLAKEASEMVKTATPVRLHTDAMYKPTLPKKKPTPFPASVPMYHYTPSTLAGDETVRSLAGMGSDIMVGQGGVNFFAQHG